MKWHFIIWNAEILDSNFFEVMRDRYHEIIAGEKEALKLRLSQIKRRHNKELCVLFAAYAAILICLVFFLLPF